MSVANPSGVRFCRALSAIKAAVLPRNSAYVAVRLLQRAFETIMVVVTELAGDVKATTNAAVDIPTGLKEDAVVKEMTVEHLARHILKRPGLAVVYGPTEPFSIEEIVKYGPISVSCCCSYSLRRQGVWLVTLGLLYSSVPVLENRSLHICRLVQPNGRGSGAKRQLRRSPGQPVTAHRHHLRDLTRRA